MDIAVEEAGRKPMALVAAIAALGVAYFVGQIIHRLYFHPLSKIPGPWINAISRVPYGRHLLAGTTVQNVTRLHEKYGEAVRVSPNEVSFISGETAWQDIYGFRTAKMKGHSNMPKDPAWYAPPPGASHILVANDEDHARFRRVLSHAFSEQALRGQEVLLQGYVDLLVDRLKESIASEGATQDMTEWYNWTTFDVIADLCFGEPFGCLQDKATHKYIKMVFASLRAFPLFYIMSYWPLTKYLRNLVLDQSVMAGRLEYYKWIASRTQQRVARETQRPDFMTEILKHNGEKGVALEPAEMNTNTTVFISAGSETTATLLSGATWLLLKNPTALRKLQDEVRGRWNSYADITMEDVNNAPYLIAVLQEALRYFPPVPTGFERKVPKGGEMVSGYFMPENTSLCVSSYPTSHSARNFKDPDAFVPERWMGDPKYADDKRTALQPFSFGPRNCLGKVRVSNEWSPLQDYADVCRHRTSHTPRCASSWPR